MTGPLVFAIPSEPITTEIAKEEEPIKGGPQMIKAIVKVLPATIKAWTSKVVGEMMALAVAGLLVV